MGREAVGEDVVLRVPDGVENDDDEFDETDSRSMGWRVDGRNWKNSPTRRMGG
jgi:hypothetical protein